MGHFLKRSFELKMQCARDACPNLFQKYNNFESKKAIVCNTIAKDIKSSNKIK